VNRFQEAKVDNSFKKKLQFEAADKNQLVQALKRQILLQKDEIDYKNQELTDLKTLTKVTKLQEQEIMIQELQNETQRLNEILRDEESRNLVMAKFQAQIKELEGSLLGLNQKYNKLY